MDGEKHDSQKNNRQKDRKKRLFIIAKVGRFITRGPSLLWLNLSLVNANV